MAYNDRTKSLGVSNLFTTEEGHTPFILGQPDDESLLGAVTLEELGPVLNPFQRKLQPMRSY